MYTIWSTCCYDRTETCIPYGPHVAMTGSETCIPYGPHVAMTGQKLVYHMVHMLLWQDRNLYTIWSICCYDRTETCIPYGPHVAMTGQKLVYHMVHMLL